MAHLKTAAGSCLLALGLGIAVAGRNGRGMSLFALGALLAASIAQSVLVPRLSKGVEDPSVVGAVTALAGLLTAFAAGIGGCLAQLCTTAVLALAFGFSALALALMFFGGFVFTGTWYGELVLFGAFGVFTWVGGWYANKDKSGATVVATALMGALLAACAVDGLIEGGKSNGRLLADLTALTTCDWESIGRCGANGRSGCHGWAVAVGWLVAAFGAIVAQARHPKADPLHLRPLLGNHCKWGCWGDGRKYTQLQDQTGGKDKGKGKDKVVARKAHSRGDSHVFSEGPRAVNVLPLRVSEGGEEEAEGGMKRTPEEVALIRMLALMYDELTNVFGFQNESAYNQVEHLVLLLGNQKRYQEAAYKRLVQPAGGVAARLADAELSPAEILHQRLFQNYAKWARHHKVEPQFDTHPGAGDARRAMAGAAPLQAWYEEPAAKQKLHDCLLWLLIWGEAANLRHMPECVAWLYHKMAGYFKGAVGKEMQERGQGYFLNNTVAPIYKVVSEGSKGKDHPERRNYDDFNEFFWSRECLKYAWKPKEEEVDPESGLPKVSVVAPEGSGEVVMVADAMKAGPKTFIEKRSWLTIFLAFRRIIDFHVLTFHLLAVYAFWDLLVWQYPYALQLLSSVFLGMNFMGIFWCGLEIWQTLQDDGNPVPAFRVTPEAKVGFAFRLIARFAFLFQQCRFYGLSLQHDGLDISPGVNITDPSKAAQVAYWWQYVWVSLLLISPWLVGCVFQIAPRLSTALYEVQDPYLRVLLDILYPQSRNYTGKHVHERPGKVAQYVAFWAIVLTGKFWFSYLFEVRPLALPALELSDDLVNLPGQNAAKTGLLIVARWAPFVAIYMLDTIIWYSVAAGLTGVLVGLSEKLGQVQTFSAVRSHFMRVAESFSSRLVFRHDDPRPSCRRKESTLTELKMPRTYTASKQNLLDLENEAGAGAGLGEAQPLVPQPQLGYRSMSSGGDFMDVATSKWKDFAKIWNAVVDNLRQTDVINNDERDMLKFHMYDHDKVKFSKPIYLPVFQTAGSVEKAERICSEKGKQFRDAVETDNEPQQREVEATLWAELREDATMYEAVSETVELGVFLLEHVLGDAHLTDVKTIKEAVETLFEQHQAGAESSDEETGGIWAATSILHSVKIEQIENVRKQLGTLVQALKGGLGGRKPKLDRQRRAKPAAQARQQGGMVRVGSAMKKSRSGFLVPSLSNPDLLAEGAAAQDTDNPEFDSLREKVQKAMRELLGGLKNMIAPNAQQPQLSNIRMALHNITDASRMKVGASGAEEPDVDNFFVHDAFYASQQLDAMVAEAKTVYSPVLAKLHGLVNLHVAEAEPRSAEARRRLTFFVNSLFMDLPKAPSVRDMMSWSVLTPFYGEDVLSSLKELKEGNEDGINTLLYLKTIYKGDWGNFIQRLGLSDEAELWAKPHFQRELRQWASLRAQTLTRTVQGMMYYEESLQVLGQLDREAGGQPLEELDEHIRRKFNYVVSCQIYGRQKQEQDAKAEDIEWLLNKHPSLRVAYIDEVRGSAGSESSFFSVLIKGAGPGEGGGDGKGVTEIYRVRLPGNPVLGEGKPENQNHAVIFTRGEHVMAIDMNQEGYFEDAFKMRNFLQEFAASDPDVPTTILGFREHIFTGGVSSLANYMALQEFSFVTLGQRVLNRPLRMRLHYGHPDVFDKLFFMQNGGVSKASKSINLSEDIFAGYNNVLRGGAVEFKEYVQVGKGRDVGMQPICKFEGKLSEGAAEQSLSRDLRRMLARLDFFRLLSFYFGGIGHYLCSVLTVTAIWGLVYLMLGLALFGLEKIGDRPIVPEGALQFALAGVGVLQTVPLFCTLLLERGFVGACAEVFSVFISGGPLYFIFHIRTRDYYYSQTVLAGGTGYKATGRGFTINHLAFDENFRFFAYSHLHLGFEVVAALVLLAIYSEAGQYVGRTWSLYFAAAAFLFAPFWFNPMTFEWGRVYDDYIRWRKWSSNTGGAVVNSWESWWKDECAYVKKLTVGSKLYLVARSSIWALIGVGLLYGPLFTGTDPSTEREVGRTVFWDAFLLLCLFLTKQGVEAYNPRLRAWQDHHMFLSLFYVLMAILAVKLVCSALFSDVSAFVFVLAGYYVLAFVTTVLFVLDSKLLTTHVVKRAHWIHDQLVAHAIFLVLFMLSVVQVVNMWQRFVLYSNSLSKGVVLDELIRNARQQGPHQQQPQGAVQPPAQASQQQQQQQQQPPPPPPRAAAPEAGATPASGRPSGPSNARIQPEEKPAEQRAAELEAAGSGGSSKKKNGRGSTAGAGASGAATQQAEAPRPTQVVEAFEFRQPTDFPKRS